MRELVNILYVNVLKTHERAHAYRREKELDVKRQGEGRQVSVDA
jgi:hypothetical protein